MNINKNVKSYKIRYATWKNRIKPMLMASGWEHLEHAGKTYFVNPSFGIRFEYRDYGKGAQIWLGKIEVMD